MCYAKPGPRCSAHASKRYENTQKRLQTVLEEVQPELDRINAEREGQEGAKRATEADLPPKLAKKLKTARGRHRDATRQFDSTPAGMKHLEERQKEAAVRTAQANKACDSYLQANHPGKTEDDVKEELKGDSEWTVLKQERTSARSELTCVSNRKKYSEQYRGHDRQEYKYEQERKAAFKAMEEAANKGDKKAYSEAAKRYTESQRNRDYSDSAELQRRREPTISFPKTEAIDAVSKREVRSSHSVNLSQGGTMRVDTQSYVILTETKGYTIISRTESQITPESDTASPMERKGFGSENPEPVKNYMQSGMYFRSAADAEKFLSDGRKDFSYLVASNVIEKETKDQDRKTARRLMERTSKNAPITAPVR